MKVGIILNGDKNAAHLKIYTNYFDKNEVKYDVISWDRTGETESDEFTFLHIAPYQESTITRFREYWNFCSFAKKIIERYNYDKLVVISPQVALFMPFFLKRRYDKRYIFDFRDLSIEQKKPFKPLMKIVLNHSFANVISSPGFKKYLPDGYNYILSHNFNIDLVRQSLNETISPMPKGDLKVLTIGAIRYDANYEVIDSLGNIDGVTLDFVGKGGASATLQEYVKEKGYNNILFKGKYEKKDENKIIRQYSMINIFYPNIPSHISALSNRFYNSLINRRPMIVTKGGEQGNYADKYGVGLSVDTCNELGKKLKEYYQNLDYEAYENNCKRLLEIFVEDYDKFARMLDTFIENK